MQNVSVVRKAVGRSLSLFMMLAICMMMLGSTSAFALSSGSGKVDAKAGTMTITIPSQDTEGATKFADSLKGVTPLEVKPGQEFKSSNAGAIATITGNTVTFNYSDFEKATSRSQKAAMAGFVNALQSSGISDQSQQALVDQMQASSPDVSRLLIPLVMDSTSADLYTAMKWLAPILPFVRIIFGVGAILISLFLIGSTILDIIYIGLPFFRERMTSGKDGGGGGGKPGMITMDAYSVVQEVESSIGGNGGYKNAYLLYFKRRVFTYVLVGFCLLYLVVGELGGLIGWIMQIGTGILPA